MTRDKLIECARSWIGTPYHHMARVKGAGVDCGQIIIASHVEAGLIEDYYPEKYTHDWHFHRDEERYLRHVGDRLSYVDSWDTLRDLPAGLSVSPGTVLVWRVGRTYSHGAIVTKWPFLVHAYFPSSIVEEVSVFGTPMMDKKVKAFSWWGDL